MQPIKNSGWNLKVKIFIKSLWAEINFWAKFGKINIYGVVSEN